MKLISIQLQPDRDPTIDKLEVVALLENAGLTPEVQEGDDNGRYVNFNVTSNNVKETWNNIKNSLLELSYFVNAAIVVCEGSEGWDDYLLLYHYDRSEKLDEI